MTLTHLGTQVHSSHPHAAALANVPTQPCMTPTPTPNTPTRHYHPRHPPFPSHAPPTLAAVWHALWCGQGPHGACKRTSCVHLLGWRLQDSANKPQGFVRVYERQGADEEPTKAYNQEELRSGCGVCECKHTAGGVNKLWCVRARRNGDMKGRMGVRTRTDDGPRNV
jgi:hypothetical protein